MEVKVGVLVPTRGDRPELLDFARKQIARQTLQPHKVIFMDEKPKSSEPDVTYRYRVGCQKLEEAGCNLFIFMEDDDWYSPEYIEKMVKRWLAEGMPELMGINKTIYYNINTQKWVELNHPARASMMSMCATPAINKIQWCDDNYSYTDMFLFTKTTLVKKAVGFDKPICAGIKHGTGLCGGGGHNPEWKVYDQQDENFKFLRRIVGEDVSFYEYLAAKKKYRIVKYKMQPKPWLTIVTRVMLGKRNGLFRKHKESVSTLQPDFQQIFIGDAVGYGMLAANKSFSLVTHDIEGEYVYLLDDDDFFTNPDFIRTLKLNAITSGADVVFFKMKILTGDGDEMYPKEKSWETRTPNRGQIGGSCFIVKKWVYEKYIHNFAHSSFGDWNFITAVLKDPTVKTLWINQKMAETGKVSRGSAE